MNDASLDRRTVLAAVAAATSGCVGRLADDRSVTVTGVRVHNWTRSRTTVRVELLRDGESVLDESVTLAPRSASGSVASYSADWSVEPARYRVRLESADGDATLDRRLPPSDFDWNGCAFVDADLEPGRRGTTTAGPDADRSFEVHLEEVNDREDFSSARCPDL